MLGRAPMRWNWSAFMALLLVGLCTVCVPSVAKAVDVVSTVALSLGGAGGQFAWASANLTEAISAVVVASTSSTLSLAEEAWKGVDLLNVTASAESGRLVIDDAAELRRYLMSPAGVDLLPVPEELRAFVAERAAGMSQRLPNLDVQRSFLNVSGYLWDLEVSFRVLDYGHLAMGWRAGWASFEPRWANPFWDVFDIAVEAEVEQIQSKAQRVLTELLRLHPRPASDSFRDVPLIVTTSWAAWWWWLSAWVKFIFFWPWTALL